jgi:hypothetical protein
MPVEVEEKILYIRKTYHLGPDRITWYLKLYNDIKLSGFGIYRALKSTGYNRLVRNAKRRTVQTVRTDNGHEFQANFPWHVTDQGIRHVYIKLGKLRLNG